MVRHVVGMATCLLMAAFSPLPPASAFVPQTANLLSGPCRSSADLRGVCTSSAAGHVRSLSLRMQSAGTATSSWETLKRWATEQKIESRFLQLKDFGGGLRGMEATKNVKEGDVLVAVPDSAVLRVVVSEKGDDRNRLPKRLGDKYVSEAAWNRLEWWGKLAVLLMWEKGQGRRVSEPSTKQPWLDSLPSSMATPLHWSGSQLNELQYQPLIDKVNSQRDAWLKLHADLAQFNPEIEKEAFVLACELVRSRAFSGPYVNKLPKDQLFLTGLLVAVSTQLQLVESSKAAIGAAAVVLFLVVQSLVLPSLLGLTHYVIAPVIDMINHEGGAKNTVSFQALQSTFEVEATTPVKAGEQVLISYGTRSNDQLLQYYGFVEAQNKDDVYEIPGLWRKLKATAKNAEYEGGGETGYISWSGLDSDGMARAVSLCGDEAKAKSALKAVLSAELASLPTTLADDEATRGLPPPPPPSSPLGLALAFRISKKQLLSAAIASL